MSNEDLRMESFCQLKNTIQLPAESKERLYHIKPRTGHTPCGKKIIFSNILIAIALCLILIPTTVFASGKVLDIIRQKVDAGVGLRDSELEQLYVKLRDQGYSDDEIPDLANMGINENGQTYGPDCMGADLILVTSDQGEDGYVYREDFYVGTGFQSPEEALAWQEEFHNKYPNGYSIKVYQCDGETVIGTFTFAR